MHVYLNKGFVNNLINKLTHAKLFLKWEYMHLFKLVHKLKMLNVLMML